MGQDPQASAARDAGLPLPALIFAASLGLLVIFETVGLLSLGELYPVLLRGGATPLLLSGFASPGLQAAAYASAVACALMAAVLIASARGSPFRPLPALLVAAACFMVAAAFVVGAALSLAGSALAGLLLSSAFVLRSEGAFRMPRLRALASLVLVALAVFAAVEALSALRWIANGFDGQRLFSDWSWGGAYADLQLSEAASQVMPQLVLLFLAAWALRLLANFYLEDVRRFLGSSLGLRAGGPEPAPQPGRSGSVLLAAAVLSAVFVGAYAYLPAVNPGSILVGTDVAFNGYYVNALNSMLALSPLQALWSVAGSDRFLLLVLQYAVALLAASSGFAIRAMPAVIGVVFAVSTYVFARVGTGDRTLAGTAALFASVSATAASSVNGGLYAAWLGAGFSLLYASLLLRALEKRSPHRVALAAAVSVALLFTHTWTWFVAMAFTVAYEVVTLARERALSEGHSRAEATAVGSVLAVNLAAYLSRLLLPNTEVAGDVTSTVFRFDPSSVLQVYSTLVDTFRYFLGGSLVDPLLFALAAAGLFALSGYGSRFNRLLLAWVLVTGAGVLFTQPSFTFVQGRMLLLAPMPLLAAIGFVALLRPGERMASVLRPGDGRLVTATRALAYILVCSAFFSYALRVVGVLYTGS